MYKFIIARTVFSFSFFILFINPDIGYAAPCTPGTNCYCDKVKGGAFNDPSVLLCEDFEAPTLINNQGVGNGAPYYGPWYDDSGQVGNRGVNSYWNRKYSNGVNGFLFSTGQPASPMFGSPCPYALCSGAKVWDAGNRWSANAYDPRLMFPSKASDFSAEVTSILPPTNTASGVAGVFDGNANLAYRIGPGNNNGIAGAARWNRVTTFGATQAVAYPSNLGASGITNNMWKHNQWLSDSSQAGGDALFLFGRTGTLDTTFPFYQMTFADYSQTQVVRTSNCAARLAAAVKTIGSFRCDPEGNFIWEPASSNYSRPVDWPLGTWGCAEAYYQNIGTANSSIQMWFTGPSGVRKKLIDISGMDLTGHAANYKGVAGYVGLSWNAYANANAGAQYGSVANTETTFRYEDNLHIRAGAPVSCAQIGFGSSGPADTTSPTTPSGLAASAISSSQISLAWAASTDAVGVSGYRIYRNGTQISTTAGTSYSDIGLTASTAYSYAVVAYDVAGNSSAQSTSASATTQAPIIDTTAPSIPTSLTTSVISSSQINLSWSASTDNIGVTGYRIYRSGTQIATLVGTSYSNTGLTASTAYSYTVSAYDVAGNNSNQSTSVSATTPAAPLSSASYITGYGMTEGSGTTLTDASGTGHTGTLVNGPLWVTGQSGYGQALSFDGINDSVSVANPSTFNFGTADFTIEAWIKRNALGGSQRHIFSKCSASTWSSGCKEFYFKSSNQLAFGSYNTGDTLSSTIADTNWHHVAATFTNSSKALNIYVDGVLTTTATKSLEVDTAGHVVTVGNHQGNNTFSGLIDDFRMYSRALTLAEIQSDKATSIAGASTPPSFDTTAPTTPTSLSATPISSSQINLSWAASTDAVGVTGYRIYRAGVLIASPTGTAYSDTNLTPTTTYTYTISAYDAAGNTSVQSSSAGATTQASTAPTPTPTPTPLPTIIPTAVPTTQPSDGGGGGSASTPVPTIAPTITSSGGGGGGTIIPLPTSTPINSPGANQTSPSTPTTSSLFLTRSLYQGLKGTDVQSLQSFLIQQGHLAPSNTTGFYGALTKQAVQKYQCAQSIVCSGTEATTGYGVVGLKTRAKLNGTTTSYVSTSTLTPAQADSIIALIQSFGADAAVIAKVRMVLGR